MNLTKAAFAVMSVFLFAGFTSANRADQVLVRTMPERPIVFTAPFTYVDASGHTVNVQAPWYEFRLSVQVPPSVASSVTVVAVNVQTSVNAPNHSADTVNTVFVPMSYSYMHQQPAGSGHMFSSVCNYTYFGTFNPDGSINNLGLQNESGDSTCATGDQVFIVGGIPMNGMINAPGGAQNFGNYTVRVTPEGWFGDLSTPTDRFMKTITATLQ